MNDILTQLETSVQENISDATATLWVGLSGGLDSTVLLHGLSQLKLACCIKAIHINHGLSPLADDWQYHCEKLAASLDVAFYAETVNVVDLKKGVEAAARKLRYQTFNKHLKLGDWLLTAHHQNDQVETFLYRLLRGAGLKGVLAMSESRIIGKGMLLRPFLPLAQEQLEAYALKNNLQWVEDDSNGDTQFDRNYLRHKVLPLLKQRWPDFPNKWLQTQSWLAESDALLNEYAQEDFCSLGLRTERLGESIDLAVLKGFSSARIKHVLRFWIDLRKVGLPDAKLLQQVLLQLEAALDKQPNISWGGVEFRRFQNRLFLMPQLKPFNGQIDAVVFNADVNNVKLPYGGNYQLPRSFCAAYGEDIALRFRQGGERTRPLMRSHSQSLKKLLQEYRIEPWLRDYVPLVYVRDCLVIVGDVFVCESSFSQGLQIEEFSWTLSAAR